MKRLARSPIVVAPHGVDLTRFRPAPEAAASDRSVRARLGVPDRYVLHLGTIEPRKKVDDLIAATEGIGVALVLGGRAWSGHEPAARRHVHRLGFVEDADVAPLMRETLAPRVELVTVTSGTGMSTAFALGEETIAALFG